MRFEPRRRSDWVVAAPRDVDLDPKHVEAAYQFVFDQNELPNICSLLVAKRGQLVAEGYVVNDADIDRLGALMSVTKSFTSVLAGIALDRGDLPNLDVSVGEVLADVAGASRFQDVRLRDALSMRAGIDYSNDDFSLEMDWGDAPDSVALVLSKPKVAEPGTAFEYTDASFHLAGALIAAHLPSSLDAYAAEHLLRPLGIGSHHWLAHRDGLNYGAYGLFLRPRDLLRFGQGMLDVLAPSTSRVAVVSQERLTEASSFQVVANFGDGFDYGFGWWVAPESGFLARGHGGQVCFCLPEQEMVVVVTGDPNSDPKGVSVSADELRRIVRLLTGEE